MIYIPLIIVLVIIIIYPKSKTQKFIHEVEFYNENSIPCSTGIKLSGSIIVRGIFSKRINSHDLLKTFLKTIAFIISQKDHEWLFVQNDELTLIFQEELKKEAEGIEVSYVKVNNLECANKEFYDPVKDAKGLLTMKAHQEEKERLIAEQERLCEEQIAKNNAEAAAKIKAMEEDLAKAEAELQEEIRKIEERTEKEIETVLKEEENTTTKK
jgi:hypothetical protein